MADYDVPASRKLTREQAARLIYDETGSLDRAAIALDGAGARNTARPRPHRSSNLTGAEARAILDEQYADPVEARAQAFVKARSRMYDRYAGDVRNGDQALAWLADHATVQEWP